MGIPKEHGGGARYRAAGEGTASRQESLYRAGSPQMTWSVVSRLLELLDEWRIGKEFFPNGN